MHIGGQKEWMDAPIIALQGSGSAGVPQADLVTLLRDGKVTSADLLALAFGPAAFGAVRLHFASVSIDSSHVVHPQTCLGQSDADLTYLAEPAMLIQILTHTPLYVWAILALLVYRGVVAMRDRDTAIRKLFIIPVIMLALSLQDIMAKFGSAFLPLSAWASGAVAMMLLVWKFSGAGISAGAAPGSVRVHGSWVPLAMMIAIFFTKYATAVTLVVQPHTSHNALFLTVVCALFGVFNGYFLGRLACNLRSLQQLRAATRANSYLTAAA